MEMRSVAASVLLAVVTAASGQGLAQAQAVASPAPQEFVNLLELPHVVWESKLVDALPLPDSLTGTTPVATMDPRLFVQRVIKTGFVSGLARYHDGRLALDAKSKLNAHYREWWRLTPAERLYLAAAVNVIVRVSYSEESRAEQFKLNTFATTVCMESVTQTVELASRVTRVNDTISGLMSVCMSVIHKGLRPTP